MNKKKYLFFSSEFLISLGVICPFFFLGQFRVFLTQEKKTNFCFTNNSWYQLENNKAFIVGGGGYPGRKINKQCTKKAVTLLCTT